METMGFYNLLSPIIGISIIITGCFIAFLLQKYYFSKKRNKVKNAIQVSRYVKKSSKKY